jgi:hypothetical protein
MAGGAFAVVIVGIMLAGSWLTAKLAAAMARLARRPPLLLAARRMHDNPSAGFRSISGLVAAAFVTSVFSGLTPAVVGQAPTAGPNAATDRVFATLTIPTGDGALAADRAATLLRTLAGTPGVTRIVDFRKPPPGQALPPSAETRHAKEAHAHPILAVVPCAVLAATAPATCPTPAATTVADSRALGVGQTAILRPQRSPQVPAATLDALPLEGLVTVTDGRAATVEQVRTIIETSAPATTPVTDADVRTARRHLLVQLQRLSNVGLLLALLVAGCSLAIAVSAGLIERKRPLALLRLSGVPGIQPQPGRPHRSRRAPAPGRYRQRWLGLAVAAMILKGVGVSGWHAPAAGYWSALAAGIFLALLTVTATLPCSSASPHEKPRVSSKDPTSR